MSLPALIEAIDSRTSAILRSHGDWPCRKGCDACCRRLAAVPRFTPAEWEMLRAALAELPLETQRGIRQRAEELTSAPYICPMLDRDSGSCLVYAGRPVACRTYGFYRERNLGLYCREMEARDVAGEFQNVVWGNALSVQADLAAYGEAQDLTAYLLTTP